MRAKGTAVLTALLLVFSIVASSGFVPPAFADPSTTATMNLWSPYDPSGFDIFPGGTATLSANAVAGGSAQLTAIEWDFDGNGSADATTPVSGSSVSGVTISHVYAIDGYYNPGVRAVDNDGFVSAWMKYDPSSIILLDVGWDPPIATLEGWTPLSGDINTEFTFTASAESEVGLSALLWDFDGDGFQDAMTSASGNSATGLTVTHIYGLSGVFYPKVAALDLQGFVGPYDEYEVSQVPQSIEVEGTALAATMNEWSPFDPDNADGGPFTVFTFSADATAADGVASLQWDFDGDEVVDATTAIPGAPTSVTDVQTTHTYGEEGVWTPAVRVVDINGVTSPWAYFIVDEAEMDLDVEASEILATLDFSPRLPSPLPDGLVGTQFTFTATASSPNPITQYDWDFEGDLVFDETTAGPSTTFTYTSPGTYLPFVRVSDANGNVGGASPKDGSGSPEYIDVVALPSAAMNEWSPYNPSGADGTPSTLFTFSANATFGGGITSIEWDFDGDGTADQTDAVAGSPPSVIGTTTTFSYGATGTWTPQVRVIGNGGYTSPWDQFDTAGIPVDLEVSDAPVATMNEWSPYNPSGADGTPGTTFTFSADASSSTGIDRIEWDFDGDDEPDDETPVPGSPTSVTDVQTTHVFGELGTWTPQARVVSTSGLASEWDVYDISGNVIELETAAVPEAALTNWAPFFIASADGYPDTVFTFTADVSAPNGIDRVEWDFDGDGTVDDTTAIADAPTSASGVTSTHNYGTTGTWTPQVRVVDVNDLASAWVARMSGGSEVELEVVERPVAIMNIWSPYNPIGADGYPGTLFTFSADGSAGAGILQLEWDFHGDGIVDKTQTVDGGPLSLADIQTTFAYTFADDFIPHVRIVDVNGTESPWDTYDEQGIQILLDVVTPPVATMNEWSPYNPSGADGTPGTAFTFKADVSAGAGIDKVEWDFDGDGNVDHTTTIANGQTSVDDVTATHTYGVVGVWTPQVRVTDGLGAVSDWDPLDASGTPIQLETATGTGGQPPSATMNVWSPYDPSGPDGNPSTEFTFSVSGFATNGIASIEWDFDGDGTVDLVTPVSGSPVSITGITATHTYGETGTWTPKARIVDVTGATSPWDAYDISGSEVSLDVDSGPAAETYCNDMTIEQLIASGQYNVIDKRDSRQRNIVGTHGADLILGNDLGVVINGLKGDDCIIAGDGNDLINAHDGNDIVYGNGGNDKIHGQNGDDSLYGGDGNDTIYGSNGNDNIYGGAGNDSLKGDNGDDYIDGGDGTDQCEPGNGHDTVVNCEDHDHNDDDHHNTGGNSGGNNYNFDDEEKDDKSDKGKDSDKNKSDDKSKDGDKKDNDKSKDKDNDKKDDNKSKNDDKDNKSKDNDKSNDDDKSKDTKNDKSKDKDNDKSKDNNGSGNNDKNKDSEDKKGSDKKEDNNKSSIWSFLARIFG